MAPPCLLGPPELYKPSPATSNAPPPQPKPDSKPATGEPFVDLMVSDFNDVAVEAKKRHDLPMGLTENCSATFLSSGDPCLDLFFHVVPDTPPEYLSKQLPKAWDHDPLKTLKLVCNLRGVRGTGKSDKHGFHTAAFWLHSHHPKTLACNLATLREQSSQDSAVARFKGNLTLS